MTSPKQKSGYLPTGRELAWFGIWTLLVLALVYFAKTHLNWKNQAKLVSERTEEAFPDEPVAITTELEPVVAEPVILAAPTLERPSVASESSPNRPVEPKPASMETVSKTVEPQPASTGTVSKTSGKGGWTPDSTEKAGDARRIHPEEVKWLQERLDTLEPEHTLSASEAYKTVREIVRRVGDVPYKIQTHGWGLPEDTLRRNEGDCADKSLLLVELLVRAGVEEVALCIGVSEDYIPGEPGHAWVQAMIGDRLWRIESTSGHMRVANSDWILDKYEAVATIWRLGE